MSVYVDDMEALFGRMVLVRRLRARRKEPRHLRKTS